MSPVSRRSGPRRPRRPDPRAGTGPAASGLRGRDPLDVLERELRRVQDATDAFAVEGVVGYVVGLLDVRGPAGDSAYEAFCREALDDARTGTSVLGLQAATVLAELGHPAVRARAASLVATADPALRAGLPAWCAHVGRVHLVEAGSLQTRDGRETVLHAVIDYDDRSAGSRHLLSVAVQHEERRVHLLDVRARAAEDSVAAIAEAYAASPTVRWAWLGVGDLEALVADAVRTTWTQPESRWPVQDVEGASTPAWALGVRRLERLTGADLRPPR
jgi:hypothetical protein